MSREHQFRFKAPAVKPPKRMEIQNVTIRETDGDDDLAAGAIVKGKGKKPEQLIDELVKLSIVAVDDRPVAGSLGCQEYDAWNSVTRTFVFNAWKSVNSIDQDELSFAGAAEPVPVPAVAK